MNIVAIVIWGLFANENAEFFDASEANAHLNWEYTGTQSVPENHVALPCLQAVLFWGRPQTQSCAFW